MTLLRSRALNVKVMEIPTSDDAYELWLRDDLEEVYALLFPAGALQRGLACDAEVRHSGARSHRLRAMVGAARLHGKLCVTCQHTSSWPFFCGASCDIEEQRRHGRWRSLSHKPLRLY